MRQPAAFVAHGAGPLPLLGHASQAGLTKWLSGYAATLSGSRPKAILVISGHWEEAQPTLTSGSAPGLIYDYYGFPEAAYSIRYPAPGSPQLAERAAGLLREEAGFSARLDPERGFDHGTFVPLKLAFPHADIPVVQLSLLSSLSPEEHISMGRALAPLRDEGVMIVGSGMTYHNMRGFKGGVGHAAAASQAFNAYLEDAIANPQHPPKERLGLLSNWDKAPAARDCHPREEHLLPLHVVAGAAQGHAGRVVHTGEMMGVTVSSYQFDA